MATVKTTQTIITIIRHEIDIQFNKRRQALKQMAQLNSSDSEYFTQRVINLWLQANGSSRAAFEAVPPSCFPTIRRCRIDRINNVRLKGYVDEVEFSREIPVPNLMSGWGGTSLELETADDPYVTDIMGNIEKVSAECAELEVERNTMHNTVEKILTTFPTLNKAVEYWPPLENLLSEDLKERLVKKVERKKAEQDLSALEDISLDSINVSLVRNKLATA